MCFYPHNAECTVHIFWWKNLGLSLMGNPKLGDVYIFSIIKLTSRLLLVPNFFTLWIKRNDCEKVRQRELDSLWLVIKAKWYLRVWKWPFYLNFIKHYVVLTAWPSPNFQNLPLSQYSNILHCVLTTYSGQKATWTYPSDVGCLDFGSMRQYKILEETLLLTSIALPFLKKKILTDIRKLGWHHLQVVWGVVCYKRTLQVTGTGK